MSDDFYPFVDSGDPAPDNTHINPDASASEQAEEQSARDVSYATRIAVYDDMFSTPRVIVIAPKQVRAYLEEITNTVYKCMKEQGGRISIMVIREIVENFIHAHFAEPIISILDGGNTIRFADQGPGIEDKERAFEFGVTSADSDQKRYIRGTGAGFPLVQQYLENAGGAVSIEDNLHQGTVITVSLDPARVPEIEAVAARGGAVRGNVRAQAAEAQSMAMPGGAFGAMPGPGSSVQPRQTMSPQPATGAIYQQPQNRFAPAQQMQQTGQPWMAQQPLPYSQQPGAYQQQIYAQPGQPIQMGWQAQPMGMPYGYAPYPAQQPTAQYQPAYGAHPAPGQTAAAPSEPYISERGMQALDFLIGATMCGPTDLVRAFGSSNATWSRELSGLAQAGFVSKHGQKYVLTQAGQAWIEEQANRG